MIKEGFFRLRTYCEAENYKGWDPYDGLNSRVFRATPLRHWDLARLVLIQLCKRSPVNLRPVLRVPKQHNAKGISLFLNGYCNLYRLAAKGDDRFGSLESLRSRIDELAGLLLSMRSPGYSGACWGYNFDWQARRLFMFPANTPTVVATTFCASALFEAYEITNNDLYLQTALSSANFVLNDLRRSEQKGGFILSYSPLPGNDTVYNASLLGAKLLSYCYHYTQNNTYKDVARGIVNAACEGQSRDGSWVYGLLPVQGWIDSFHSGYNLEAISYYARFCEDDSYDEALQRGLDFYLSNFFLADGTPKYYHDEKYPIDIHCPGQLLVTMSAVGEFQRNSALCEKVANWTLKNMQDKRGYFYYQVKRVLSSKISYMRWSNAFMFNALSYFLVETHGE